MYLHIHFNRIQNPLIEFGQMKFSPDFFRRQKQQRYCLNSLNYMAIRYEVMNDYFISCNIEVIVYVLIKDNVSGQYMTLDLFQCLCMDNFL